jgi:hypothetical protein
MQATPAPTKMYNLPDITTAIALFLVLVLALLLAPNRLYQCRRSSEPPLIAGFLPWLGVGLDMRNMENFLPRNFAKYGLTFTAYAAGKRLVFTKDLAVVQHMVKSSDFAATPVAVSSFLFLLRPTKDQFLRTG